MIFTELEVLKLMQDMESEHVERTISLREDKLGPIVCAFSNDFSRSNKSGIILLGVNDNGDMANIKWSDEDLQKIGSVKSNGKVLPQPSISVSQVYRYDHGEVVIIEVKPSTYPPVRYDGRCWIRVGPRRAIATVEEERMLTEKRAMFAKTYDLLPEYNAKLSDLKIDLFKLNYLTSAIDKDTLEENGRSIQEQLASLRMYDSFNDCPTNAGVLLFAVNPEHFLPGAYIQYVKFDGEDMTANVIFEKKFSGPMVNELRILDDFIKNNIIKERPIKGESFKEKSIQNYSYWATRELFMNAMMHRNYESNAPIYIYEFADRIEIVNPGSLFGEATPQNFPNTSDYRNVVISEALKVMGYVNKFNYGVKRAIDEMKKNGNMPPIFDLSLGTKFKVTLPIHESYL